MYRRLANITIPLTNKMTVLLQTADDIILFFIKDISSCALHTIMTIINVPMCHRELGRGTE